VIVLVHAKHVQEVTLVSLVGLDILFFIKIIAMILVLQEHIKQDQHVLHALILAQHVLEPQLAQVAEARYLSIMITAVTQLVRAGLMRYHQKFALSVLLHAILA